MNKSLQIMSVLLILFNMQLYPVVQSLVTQSTKKVLSAEFVRNFGHYYSLGGRFRLSPEHSYYLTSSESSSACPEILGLCKNYEDELEKSRKDSDEKKVNCFIGWNAIHQKFQEKYKQEHAKLYHVIVSYHEKNYIKNIADLKSVCSHDKVNNSIVPLYEETFKDYTGYPEYPAGIDSYYHHAKAINFLEWLKEVHANKLDLRNYIFDYVATKKADKWYDLRAVTFDKPRYDGRPAAIATYDPNDKSINISSDKFFEDQSLTEQALTTMHEVEHAAQDPWLDYYPAEQGAEHKSVQECNCAICLQVKAALLKGSMMPHGYFSSQTFQQFADKSITLCKAHAGKDLTQLQDAIKRADKKAIKAIDNSMGTLYDRLPVVKKRNNL
ncbi:MAG: hypothetical protein ACXWL5_03080 [Candidatus Chromulinivorax sp.]